MNVSLSKKTEKPLQPGTRAPDFTLKDTPDQAVSLHDFSGKKVVLIFYPADWSPVCGNELAIFNELLPDFQKLRTGVVGISVDGIWCHLAYAKDRNLHFPLLSDFNPKGAVAQTYGVYREKEGESERALFVIDQKSIIRWSYISPIGLNPGAGEVLDVLMRLHKT